MLSKDAWDNLLRLAERWEAVVEKREGSRNSKEYLTDPIVGAATELRVTLGNTPYDTGEGGVLELLIFCPVCKTQHVDVGKFATEPHKRHSCQNCGLLFSVTKDVPNVGVKFFRGCRDSDHHVTINPTPGSQPYISPGVIPNGMEITARLGDQILVFTGPRW